MRLVSLRLTNVRSYTNATVEFPSGISLLSGDIGAGKSTLLLAIEFALFGLLRSELPGASLLRHGAKTGRVVLTLEIAGKAVVIERGLRRSKDRVEQDVGALTIGGVREPLSPAEIKARVFALLGYPEGLVSKHKGLLYRYTVYTPQEEMKRIIREPRDERMKILRQVFGIDRYQRVRENALGYARAMRERSRRLEGEIVDLPRLEEDVKRESALVSVLAQKALAAAASLDSCRARVKASREAFTAHEARRKESEQLKLKERTLSIEIAAKAQAASRLQQDLERVMHQRAAFADSPEQASDVDPRGEIVERLQETQQLETNIRVLTAQLAQSQAGAQAAQQEAARIRSLGECPTCKQVVADEHKQRIESRARERVSGFEGVASRYRAACEGAEARLVSARREIDGLRELEKTVALQRERVKQKAALQGQAQELQQEIARVQSDAQELSREQQRIAKCMRDIAGAAVAYERARRDLDDALAAEHQAALAHARLDEELKHLRSALRLAQDALASKRAVRARLVSLRDFEAWLVQRFSPLAEAMERQAFARVFNAFSSLFSEWFSILVDDPTMQARLDESFTPILQQGGYDLAFEYISGGERTACALSYRLALNRAINDLVSTIRTKDILILDEPTDGFSADQLDSLRDVLRRLALKQVLLVSHEVQLEGLVDHVLRIQKRNGSSVLTT